MLFVTNRFPKQSIESENGRKFSFDLKNNAPSNSVFFCKKGKGNSHTEIGSLEFLRRIKESKYRQVLLFLHGFSNLPKDVFRMTAELQDLCDKKKKKEVLVVPLIWPCDNDLGTIKIKPSAFVEKKN